MENNRFYHTDSEAPKPLLLLNDYKELESACYDDNAQRFLIIDSEKREFWVSDEKSLDECKQITHLHYHKEIKPTTLKELKLWLN